MGLRDEEELEGRRGDPQEEEKEEEEEEEEEELEDPLINIRTQCEKLEKCVKTKEILDQCNSRVSSRTRTTEECSEELFDFLHARDHCVAHKLFSSLK